MINMTIKTFLKVICRELEIDKNQFKNEVNKKSIMTDGKTFFRFKYRKSIILCIHINSDVCLFIEKYKNVQPITNFVKI